MKIAIAGYGAEGESNYQYWNTPDNQVVIIDENTPARALPVDVSVIIGEDAFARLDGYDLVVRTAGLAPRKIKTDGKLWSATNEFFDKCPAPIIGVTGSKGKGTTSSLIASTLRAAGRTVHLVGNIGVPALDALPNVSIDDIVVYELSSFQLWDLEQSPHIAVVLMIEPDHLDVHADFAEYIQAKANIVHYQNDADFVVYNGANQYATAIGLSSQAQQLAYQSPQSAHVKEGSIWYGEQELCSVDVLHLPGVHNQDNACAAINAVWPYVQDGDAIARGLANFSGLPHRLKLVRRVNDVAYYDDSIATTPGSAIAAVKAFDTPKVLIVGGSSKGADFDTLTTELANDASIRAIICIGETGPLIERQLKGKGSTATIVDEQSHDMQQIVSQATEQAHVGDVVILSPACASFDMFKNYSDRGDQYIAAVNSL
jgi:UDP-N-acetylmuramoylalanine--D-glutamate ligase